jgi:hypothetical protein
VGGPAEPAAEAWQRAVDVVIAEPPDAAREPRIREADAAPLTAPLHPIFWSGYMLVDGGTTPPPEAPVPAAAKPKPAAAKPNPAAAGAEKKRGAR